MLQLPLPKSVTPKVKSGPMKGMPKSCQATCPVLILGLQYESLVVEFNELDRLHRDAEADRLWDSMVRITNRVSRITPKSFEGAAFQVMLAYSQIDVIQHGATDKEKDASRVRAERLLYRAMERIGYKNDDGWVVLRRWLLPTGVDGKAPRRGPVR